MADIKLHPESDERIPFVAKIRSRLKLDATTVLLMLKGGLPPLILTAIDRTTFGYMAAILAVSAQCLLPRAKFTKILFFSVLPSCAAAALCYVAIVCYVRASQGSISPDASLAEREGYNSGASVVPTIWLLIGVWLANAFRSYIDSRNYRTLWLQHPSSW